MNPNKPKSVFDQLDEGNVPEVVGSGLAQASAPQPAAPAVGDLSQLLQILLAKEAREAAKEQRLLAADEARRKQRDRNSREMDSKILLKQARCKHLKGGKKGPKTQQKDYAVAPHTFPNAETVIRCHICGMRWRVNDTAEWLLRNGKKISNHTKIGWREAVQMCDQSTNTASMSEIPGQVVTGRLGNNQTDAAGIPFEAQIRDSEGNVAQNVEL